MFDVDPKSSGNQFRKRRIQLLRVLVDKVVSEKGKCQILDVGGTYSFWSTWKEHIDWSLTEVTCVNRDPSHLSDGSAEGLVKMVSGDACCLDWAADNSFDAVFSNSVIEHVGNWSRMRAMADEITRVAPRHLIQTPYFWFPIEPHSRTALLHWVPESWSYRMVMSRKRGFWPKADNVSDAVQLVQSAKMLDVGQMKELFPHSEILREKIFGVTKSLMAFKLER